MSKRLAPHRRLEIETLEDRTLLATGLYTTLRGGVLSVTGTEGNMIQMQDVRIEIFDEQFHQTAELKGKTATTFKDNPDLILEPADCVFVDDLPGNLKPARDLGMATVHHTAAADTVPELERLLSVRLR